MISRGAWSGILLGLLVGTALGVFLWKTWTSQQSLKPAVEADLTVTGGFEAGDVVSRVDSSAAYEAPQTDSHALAEPLGRQRSNAIVEATRRVAPAVVSINVVQQQSVPTAELLFMQRLGFLPRPDLYRNVRSMGSGVIIREDGLIVTNDHVVAGAVQIIVTLADGRQTEAQLLEEVDRYDLAFLKIEGENFPVAPLASGQGLQIGEWAIAIGSPFGYLLADTQPTVTVGVISAVNRDIKKSGDRFYLGMIQTDAAINPGNSGGPLVNTDGEVVGINTFIFSESGGSVGIGFAVPVGRVMTVANELDRYGRYRKANIGFTLQILSPYLVREMGLDDPVGAIIWEVGQDSPAWKAGLRAGDILRVMEGFPLDNWDGIQRLYYNSSVGDRLAFRAERNGELWSGEIILEEQP